MSTETRPFQVGARLRMTHVYSTRPNQTHEGTIGEIEPAGFDDIGGPFPPYVVLRDDSGKYLTSFPLAYDGTRIEFPESYQVEFLDDAPTDPSDGAVTSTPAPSDDTTPGRVLGFNVVTIDPEGNHNGPRLDGAVTRERALAYLDELAPFMTDGYTTVLVELREVAR